MTTPHPSAVRAAKALHIHNEQAVLTAAEFIDRETGVGELVAALEQIKMTCEVHSWADWSGYSDSHLEFMIRNEPDRGMRLDGLERPTRFVHPPKPQLRETRVVFGVGPEGTLLHRRLRQDRQRFHERAFDFELHRLGEFSLRGRVHRRAHLRHHPQLRKVARQSRMICRREPRRRGGRLLREWPTRRDEERSRDEGDSSACHDQLDARSSGPRRAGAGA